MSFVEERFNTEIRYGVVGGPEFSTNVVTTESGFEQRNLNWSQARGKWQCATDLYNKAEIDALIAFFRNRQGKFQGFRFKDWADYQDNGTGILQSIASSTTVFQMAKNYTTTGGATLARTIKKPVSGTILIFDSTSPGAPLVAGTDYTLDYTTGIVTFTSSRSAVNLSWTGEFDVPARFDTDSFNADFQGFDDNTKERLFTISGLTIVELKQ